MSEGQDQAALEEVLVETIREHLVGAEGSGWLLLRQLEREISGTQPSGGVDPRYAHRMLHRLQKAIELLGELRGCSKAIHLDVKEFSPTRWVLAGVQGAKDQLPSSIRESLGFSVDVAEKKSRIQGDPRLLDRALRDLLVEAALQAGCDGRVRVRGRQEEVSGFLVTVESVSGKEAHEGTRSAEAELAHARAKRIVEAHGGSVEHDGDPKRGEDDIRTSRISLRVPAREGEEVLR